MGNEDIGAIQKQALSDADMKQAVEQVLKNPEMLNEFKNFFKGGGKWKKRRTRRRRGANGDSEEEGRTRSNAVSDEELDTLVFHDMSFQEYADAKEIVKELKNKTSQFNNQLELGINIENNKIMINRFTENIEELESKMSGMVPGKKEKFDVYLEFGDPKERTKEFQKNYEPLGIYGGKRRRRQTKRAGMKKNDKVAEEQKARKFTREQLKREQESRKRLQQLKEETLEEKNARHARLKIGMQATADFGPAVQNLDLKLHNASPEVDKLMEATSRAQSPLGEVLDAAFKQPSKGGKSRRIPRRKRKRKRKRMKTKRRRKKKRRTRRKRR